MPYSNFTLSKVKSDFRITTIETETLFPQIEPVQPGELLRLNLKENLSLATAINTEKARSELIIMPVLTEVRRVLKGQVSLFSGVEFNVDLERGLNGTCDFILARSPEQFFVTQPVVTIVEAKRENIPSGLGQCIASMIAAKQFNEQEGEPIPIIYGVVTTGTEWKFLKLIGQTAYIDSSSYFISEVDQILGILVATVEPEPGRVVITQ
ncbi:hypothetical protein [Leptolyngbya sp. FACHB-711]|uniref:hypothetical protein n=1 Tax=Leptolyngbya sp. FACHB-711 TaxID=2692813 RepID=UPI00168488E4|nr:hypothetical protein [Leptolyngbya sp. FACHB-711]